MKPMQSEMKWRQRAVDKSASSGVNRVWSTGGRKDGGAPGPQRNNSALYSRNGFDAGRSAGLCRAYRAPCAHGKELKERNNRHGSADLQAGIKKPPEQQRPRGHYLLLGRARATAGEGGPAEKHSGWKTNATTQGPEPRRNETNKTGPSMTLMQRGKNRCYTGSVGSSLAAGYSQRRGGQTETPAGEGVKSRVQSSAAPQAQTPPVA